MCYHMKNIKKCSHTHIHTLTYLKYPDYTQLFTYNSKIIRGNDVKHAKQKLSISVQCSHVSKYTKTLHCTK